MEDLGVLVFIQLNGHLLAPARTISDCPRKTLCIGLLVHVWLSIAFMDKWLCMYECVCVCVCVYVCVSVYREALQLNTPE